MGTCCTHPRKARRRRFHDDDGAEDPDAPRPPSSFRRGGVGRLRRRFQQRAKADGGSTEAGEGGLAGQKPKQKKKATRTKYSGSASTFTESQDHPISSSYSSSIGMEASTGENQRSYAAPKKKSRSPPKTKKKSKSPPKKTWNEQSGSQKTDQQPKKKTYRWSVSNPPNTKAAPVEVVRAETTSVFDNEDEQGAEGLSMKERMKILKDNMKKASEVDDSKAKALRKKKQGAIPLMNKDAKARATDVIKKMTLKSKIKKDEMKELFAVASAIPEDGKGPSSEVNKGLETSGDGGNKKLDPAKGVNFNNNETIAKLSGKKQEEAFESLVKLAKVTKGTFSSTNCHLNNRFVEMLVEGVLQPGVNPSLTCLNLESNRITNPGFEALALAIKDLPNIKTVKLRHQTSKPSVPIQELFLEAVDKNKSITKLGVDFNRELGRRCDKLISRNVDITRRQKRQAAKMKSSGSPPS